MKDMDLWKTFSSILFLIPIYINELVRTNEKVLQFDQKLLEWTLG